MVDLNRAKTWLDASIHDPPAVDAAKYQEQVDVICGLNSHGKPNILLSWMPAMENYSKRYCEWDKAGFGTKTHLRGVYVYQTIWDGENPIDIPPPRWALKQWQDGSQYALTDDKTRWQTSGSGSQTSVREVRPPLPRKGYYIPLMRIGRHTIYCCHQQKKNGEKCWGDYRKPDEHYLTLLRKAVRERAAENEDNPNAPITNKTLVKAAREAVVEIQQKEQEADERLDGFITEHLPKLLAYYTGEKGFAEKTKEFSLPAAFKETSSGLAVPK